MTPLEIVYEDNLLLAVNKPAGLLVHRSRIAADENDCLLDRLRTQTGMPLHLAHRLDRATSGVLLLAKSREVAGELGRVFMARAVEKTYLAVVRGWPEAEGTIDYALPDSRDRSPRKPALTRWRVLATAELPIAIGKYPQQRYALIEARPETGRYRQIRKHFHHVSHHIVGDTSHGRGDHNRLWRMHFNIHRLLLHAWRLSFAHPLDGTILQLQAEPDTEWQRAFAAVGWDSVLAPAGPANC
ncbi:MAG: pseudouridine synthase [Rudaea sp.]|nr:pseudouridine synthase [Rudaea sp.]